MKFLKHCGVMIALLLALSLLFVGCDRGGVTDGTSEQTKEEILEESFPEEIVFVSNGDGTCYVDGFASPDRLQTVELVIPEKSPAGDTVTEIRQLGDAGVLVPYILTPEDFEVMRQKVLAYYGGDEENFDYKKFMMHWIQKGLEFCHSDRLKDDLLATYPITAITNIYVFYADILSPDITYSCAVLSFCDQVMAEAYPEYTHARRLRDLAELIARAESEGLQEHGLSGYLELYQSKKIGAASFKSIVLPDTVTKINDRAFAGCVNLESIHMPDQLTSIGEYAFSDCAKLTSIELPDGITSIGGHAFEGCIGLETVKIPENIANIAEWAFSGCKNLTKIEFPNGLARIERYAFLECTNLTTVGLPDSLTSIDEYAFSGCTKLAVIKFPAGITRIGTCAFEGCEGLTEITIPDSIAEIESSVFSQCISLRTVVLPEGLEMIDYYAFNGCRSLTSLNIPESVSYIGSGAFKECDGMFTRVFYDNHALYYVDHWVVVADLDAMVSSELILEDGIVGIYPEVFKDTNLERVVLPDSIRVIGEKAFENCRFLREIVIPEGVVSIESKAFAECLCLNEIVIPKSVKELDCKAFSENTRICYVGTQEEWEAISFSNDYALADLDVVYNYVPES